MIYDRLDNIERYKGIHPNLDQGIDFLLKTELKTLPLGKTVIDGEKVFINVMEATLNDADTLEYEFHQKYLDIQIDLTGEEKISIGFLPNFDTSVYEASSDFGTVTCQTELCLPLGENRFIICMTNEPHKPGIRSNQGATVKKGVVKILMT